jgi:predicted O-linked N-acetylglucosamine transferase (SPINDLY family)
VTDALMQSIEQGVSLHRAGRMAEAEAVYRSILAREPRHFDALYMLGVIHFQNGFAGEAREVVDRAVELRPKSAQALSLLMAILLALGQGEQALAISDRILAINPDDLDTLYNRALLLSRLRRFPEALAFFDKVLARNKGSVDALFERGNALVGLSRYEEAAAAYDKVLRLQPSHIGALTNRGNALLDLRRHEDALDCYDRVLAVHVNDLNALNNRAIALKELGRYEEATASCERALTLDARFALALVTRGNIQLKLLHYEKALASFDAALAISRNDADALNNRGFALTELRRIDEALTSLNRALAIAPGHVGALDNKGVALFAADRFEEALASFDRALASDPKQADLHYHRGQALSNLARYQEAIAAFRQARAIDPKHFHALSALAFYQRMVCDWKEADLRAAELKQALDIEGAVIEPFALLAYSIAPADHLRCARRYGQFRMAGIIPFAPVAPAQIRRSSDKLKLAYLSSALQRHPTGWQIVELIELHDRSRFEVHAMSYGFEDGSDIRARLVKGFDHYHEVALRSDHEVARLIRDLGIHIAVDLKGYTEKARPGILAYRPAPIQVSYLGYPASMGIDFIDYILADPIVLPMGQQAHYSEKIVQLPDSYWPSDSKRQVAEETPSRRELGLPHDGFVFCCFNNTYKITPEIFDRWMVILREIKDGVLWLLDTGELATRNLRNEAQSRGVEPHRLVFAPKVEVSQHLARHRAADLFLDNLPYNAHTGASDVLWTGLPVLTCAGEAFCSRVAASLLSAVGLPELVTHTLDEYEALALKLATDRTLLAGLRAKLERNRLGFPLFNTDRLRSHIERAYERMWEIFQNGEPPQPIAIERLGS